MDATSVAHEMPRQSAVLSGAHGLRRLASQDGGARTAKLRGIAKTSQFRSLNAADEVSRWNGYSSSDLAAERYMLVADQHLRRLLRFGSVTSTISVERLVDCTGGSAAAR